MENEAEIIKEWVRYADEDLRVAEIIIAAAPEYNDKIGFHCQQAVEKYLKAYLIYLGIKYPRTHNLTVLIELIEAETDMSITFYDKALILNYFAVEVRYPFGRIDLNSVDVTTPIIIAKEFQMEIKNRINI